MKHYKELTAYECDYCHVVHNDKDMAEEHAQECPLNRHVNKNCLTCSNFEVHKFAPQAKNYNGYINQFAKLLLGGVIHNKFYCTVRKRYIVDNDFDKMDQECYTQWDGESLCEQKEMPCFKEYWEQMEKEIKEKEKKDK